MISHLSSHESHIVDCVLVTCSLNYRGEKGNAIWLPICVHFFFWVNVCSRFCLSLDLNSFSLYPLESPLKLLFIRAARSACLEMDACHCDF